MAELTLALRNLLRNRRRTLIALATLIFGVVAMLLAGGFIEWIFYAIRESTIQSRLGHIQVVRPGYFDAGAADPYAFLLQTGEEEQQAIAQFPHVKIVAPRLAFTGLISYGENTVSFISEGVDPDAESTLSPYLLIREGQALSGSDPDGLVLGSGLARNLGVKPGDQVVLLATTSSGGINAVEVRVRGLFSTSSKSFDDTALRLPISTARKLLHVSGAHTWVLLLDDTIHTASVLENLRERFPEQTSKLRFVPWQDLADFYNKTVQLFSRQMLLVQVIITLIILLAISNVAVMNVLERTGEIGTMMAIGLRRGKVLRLFLYEGAMLGVVGGLVGILLGLVLAKVISAVGIPMPPPPGMDMSVSGKIFVTGPLAAQAFSMAVVSSVLAGLYPAWKASRLVIVDALRRNR